MNNIKNNKEKDEKMIKIWIDYELEEWTESIEELINLCGYRNERNREFVEIDKIKDIINRNNLKIELKDCIAFCKKNYYECEIGKFHTNLNNQKTVHAIS